MGLIHDLDANKAVGGRRSARGERGSERTFAGWRFFLLQRLVGRTPGVISYVRRDLVMDVVGTIRIDGKTPDDPGYPLLIEPESR